jgi:hypothetical protein
LVIASHSECAAHPVPDSVHRQDLQKAVARLAPLCPGMDLRTVHVEHAEGAWTVVESGVDIGGRPEARQEAVR